MVETTGMVLGVDGGGTASRFALRIGARRYDHVAGPVNVTSDLETAIANLLEGLEAVAAKADVRLDDLAGARAFLGLAGVLGPNQAEAVASRLPLRNARIDSDSAVALAGALGGETGTLAGLGTGSFMIRRAKGATRSLGGWGLALGDEASGGWLGRGLLARTLQASDDLAAHSDLTKEVLAQFEGQPNAISVYGAHAGAQDFADFAPRIFEAASAGDAVALDLIASGARWIETGAQALGWREGESICLTGGIGPAYAPYLSPQVRASMVEAKATGLDGALLLADRMAPG